MMNLAQQHRHALCDSATLLGPDAPTLCDGWRVRDLVVHLVIRDGRPDAALGAFLPPLQRYTRSVQDALGAGDFAALVERVRSGPPRLSPASLSRVDDAINTAEFLVHHEDILRAQPEPTAHASNDPETVRAAWSLVRKGGRILYRTSPVGVVAVAPGSGRAALRRPPSGHGSVVLTGEPVELLLHAFGRTEYAAVEVAGDSRDVAAFTATELGV